MSQYRGSLSQRTAELHHPSKKHTEATQPSVPLAPRADDETLDPGSLTSSQIEDDNEYFYGADDPFLTLLTAKLSRPDSGGGGGRVEQNASSRSQTMSSGSCHVDVYTFRKFPGNGGGTMITCPSDVILKSLARNGVEFRRKKKRDGRWRNTRTPDER
ncbi:hypothetical protein N431DRAFT_551331 [Stipitochalara longipes BDJ]|nr:hypothetical protein N431DRAFT_551331 [Stipitochalara longipes BDJ]